MRGYEEYRESRVKWLGEIPAHWEVVRLSRAANIIMGQSPEGKYLNQFDGVEFHQSKIFFGDKIIKSSDIKTSAVTKIAPANSVLLCVRAPVGKVNITDREICIGRGLAALDCLCGMSYTFLYYMLQHYEDAFKQEATGSTFEAITVPKIAKTYIPVPPRDEQDQIARFLDWKISAIDRLILLRHKQFTDLEDLKKSAISRAVTRGLNPEVELRDSGVKWLGQIPSGWGVVRLKRLFKTFSGATPDSGNPYYWNGDIVWITPADFQTKDKYIYHGAKHLTEAGFHACSTSLVPSGSIIFSKRAPVGKVAINKVDLCTNQGCLACVPLPNVIPDFFYYVISICTGEFESLSAGTTFKEISLAKFKDFLLPLPPTAEQQQISTYLDKLCSLINQATSNLSTQIDTLRELKARLISDTVTGKIDVRQIPIPGQENP